MKSYELLNTLLADLTSININLHNLHWNITGDGFDEYHVLTEEIYDDVFAKYDEVAEILKTEGEFPVSSLQEYAKQTKVEPLVVKDYKDDEVIAEVKKIYNYLLESFCNIRKVAIEEDNFIVQNSVEGYIADYSKRLWMLDARTK